MRWLAAASPPGTTKVLGPSAVMGDPTSAPRNLAVRNLAPRAPGRSQGPGRPAHAGPPPHLPDGRARSQRRRVPLHCRGHLPTPDDQERRRCPGSAPPALHGHCLLDFNLECRRRRTRTRRFRAVRADGVLASRRRGRSRACACASDTQRAGPGALVRRYSLAGRALGGSRFHSRCGLSGRDAGSGRGRAHGPSGEGRHAVRVRESRPERGKAAVG